jgi:hypothetical protein
LAISEDWKREFGNLSQSVENLPARYWQMAEASELERQRTKKFVKIPQLTGQAVGGVLNTGGDSNVQRCGPDLGYIWSISYLAIEGLTTGASQDTVQIFRSTNTGQGRLLWQLTGNQPVSTFGKGQLPVWPGDTLYVVSLGTFSATGPVTLSGAAREVAAQRMGEVF